MNALTKVDKIIIDKLLDLTSNDKSEILNFIEFVRIRQDRSFIDYVSERSKKAVKAIAAGEDRKRQPALPQAPSEDDGRQERGRLWQKHV